MVINQVNMINIFASVFQHIYMETLVQDVGVYLTVCVSSHATDTKTRYNSWILLFENRCLKTTSSTTRLYK